MEIPMNVYEVEGGQFNTEGMFGSGGRATWFAGSTLRFRTRLLPYQRIDSKEGRTVVFDLDSEPHLNLFCIPLGRLRFIGERSYRVEVLPQPESRQGAPATHFARYRRRS